MEQKETRRRGQRRLFIEFLIMFLVSILVFFVLTYVNLLPQMLKYQQQINYLTDRVTILHNRVVQLSSVLDEQEAERTEAIKAVDEKPEPAEEPTVTPAKIRPKKASKMRR